MIVNGVCLREALDSRATSLCHIPGFRLQRKGEKYHIRARGEGPGGGGVSPLCLVWEVRVVGLAIQYSLFDMFWLTAVSVGMEDLPLRALLFQKV